MNNKKYTAYTIENARAALPHLIYVAQCNSTITYKELASRIGLHHRAIPHALGYIRDVICIPRKLPLINVLVVNGKSRLPGESFLPEGTANLSKEEVEQAFQKYRDEILSYPGWDALLLELGLSPIA